VQEKLTPENLDQRFNTVHPQGHRYTDLELPVSPGRNVPIDPNEVAKLEYRSARLDRRRISRNGVLFLASDASSYVTGAELGDRRCHDGCHETSMGAEASGLVVSSVSVWDARVLLNLL
jgi:hypothetical protein